MLILTRKIGEGVTIGADIRVVVLEVRGKQVRLGIEAPMDVVVLRDEIARRLIQENLLAAGFLPGDLPALQQATAGRITGTFPLPESPPEVPRLTINSTKFGDIQIQEDRIITFAQGLLGFSGLQRYALLARPETSPFLLLQSLEQPEGLLVAEPVHLVAEFRCNRLGAVLAELEVQSLEELQVLVIVNIPPGQPQAATANLVSPILINPKLRRGKQVVLEHPQYSYRHRFLPD